MAGAGLAANNGQLSVQGNSVSALHPSGTAGEGYNYMAVIGADSKCFLPASPSAGDVVTIKFLAFTGSAKFCEIIPANITHDIDDQSFPGGEVKMESPFGAVSFFYAGGNKWLIV